MSKLKNNIQEAIEFYSKFTGEDASKFSSSWDFLMDEVITRIGEKYYTPCCYNLAEILTDISEFLWKQHGKNLKTFEDLYYGAFLYIKNIDKSYES